MGSATVLFDGEVYFPEFYDGTCVTCGGVIRYQECPTGGWWIHEVHADDDHDATPLDA